MHKLDSVALDSVLRMAWHLQVQSAAYTLDIAIAEEVLTW